jgi:ornithine--oxo-acid transaminase
LAPSGSEGVEATIKIAPAHTRRAGILSAEDGFHGLTRGALPLMGRSLLEGGLRAAVNVCEGRSIRRLKPLDRELKTKPYAALMVEPIQSEAGVCAPPADYLRTAESSCRRCGTRLVRGRSADGDRPHRFISGAAAPREVAEPAHSPGAFRAEALGLARRAFRHELAAIRLQFLTRA